jgi:hypothetical protein
MAKTSQPLTQRVKARNARTPRDINQSKERLLYRFEPVLQAIAAVGASDSNELLRYGVNDSLARFEQQGLYITDAVQRIWQGERDAATLTACLDRDAAILVGRLLEIVDNKE